jgi:leucyl-tRNA synthetase
LQKWPSYNENKTVDDTITIPIQENGKLRTTIDITANTTESEVIQHVMQLPRVIHFINNRPIKKTIYIKNKIVNIII